MGVNKMKKVIRILAGNKEEFEEFIKNLSNEYDYVYINNPEYLESLKHLKNFKYRDLSLMYIGSYLDRSDITEIFKKIEEIKDKGEWDNMDLEATYITVNVRWWDGYLETFQCQEVRGGCDLLWLRLLNGQNRNIPLRQVRWYSQDPESHAK